MGKLRIVQQNETFQVEECKNFFDQRENAWYESWITLKRFFTLTAAETFAEEYVKQHEKKKPKVVKTYNF